MSLINQMLKDLEKKPKKNSSATLINGLSANLSLELKKNKTYYFIIFSLILILFLSLFFLILYYPKKLQVPLVKKQSEASRVISQVTVDSIPLENAAMRSLLTGIALQMHNDMTNLRFLLNQNTFYRLSEDVIKNQLVIIFDKTQLVAALPKINYSGSGIQSIQAFKDENGNLKLILQMETQAELKKVELTPTNQSAELQLDIFYKNIENVVENRLYNKPTIPVTIKKPVTNTIIEDEYQRALQFATMGQTADALQILSKLLTVYPNNTKVREYAINLLLQQGRSFEASRFIDQGLQLEPMNATYLKSKARLLVEEGKIKAALILLKKFNPEMTTDPEYYAFIAALYQRIGQSSLAGKLYKELLTLQPANAKWWVGFGIALETQGHQAQALEAYTNADNIGGLNPNLKNFLTNKLHST